MDPVTSSCAGTPRDVAVAVRAHERAKPEQMLAWEYWRVAPEICFSHDSHGAAVPGHNTTVQMLWDAAFLTVRFTCKYKELHLRHGLPALDRPSDALWNHDVAEVFIAAGDAMPTRYAEFEVSPRGEWIALHIETTKAGAPAAVPLHDEARFAALIDHTRHTWHGLIQVPFSALMQNSPSVGTRFRLNLFRSQGPRPVELAWQPTLHPSFHVPERFGLLVLADKAE